MSAAPRAARQTWAMFSSSGANRARAAESALVRKKAGVDDAEMYRDFNMGIGMIAVVPYHQTEAFLSMAPWEGEKAHLIGEIVEGPNQVVYA
mgnify:CR=1 FL=1